MLDAQIQLHREFLLANVPNQRLFIALHLQPQEAARIRSPLAVAFVVDTSGSMRQRVTRPTGFTDMLFGKGINKLSLVTEALRGLLNSELLIPDDRLSLTQFDDGASVLVPFTSASDHAAHVAGAEALERFNGGTEMGKGMQAARKMLEHEPGHRRMILLTDGQTGNEKLVLEEAARLADLQVPVTTVGVGSDLNTALLTRVADLTQGQPMDVVPDAEEPHAPSVRASDLPAAILGDLAKAANEVISNTTLTMRTLKDVVVERVTRVQPTQTEVDIARTPLMLGNLDASSGSTYVIELSVPARPASRIRLGQLHIGYQVPGRGAQAITQLPPIDVVVEFTADDQAAAQVRPEVMRWVQQRNVEGLIVQATRQMASDPQQAHESLQVARQMTERLGNTTMTRVIDQAMGELNSGRKISSGTAKTLQMGAKTQTLQAGDKLPNDDDIRRMTGA